MVKTNDMVKNKWRVAILAGLAMVCVGKAISNWMVAAPKWTVRFSALVIAIALFATVIYVLCRTRRFRLSTFIFGGPLIAALLVIVVTPYARNQRLLTQLKQAGIDHFQLEPTLFEAKIEYLVSEFLGEPVVSFRSNWISGMIHLDDCRTDKLRHIRGGASLTHIFVFRTNPARKYTAELIAWLNSLQDHTKIAVSGHQLDDADVSSLRELNHPASYQISGSQCKSAIDFVFSINAESLVLMDFVVPEKYVRPTANGTVLNLTVVGPTNLSNQLIVDFVESKQVQKLVFEGNCNLTAADCSRLANVPSLKHVSMSGLDFDALSALSTSKSLRVARFNNPKLTESEIGRISEAFGSKVEVELSYRKY